MLTPTTTAASPSNVINAETSPLFGPASTSQTSAVFTVNTDPFYISAYNLAVGDTVTVMQVAGTGSGTETAPFAPVFGAIVLSTNRTRVRIDYPGRYQLVHAGPSALGTFTVLGGAVTMTVDSLADLADALATVIVNQGLTVQGASPVVVTGQGTISSPYLVTTPDIIVPPDGTGGIAIGHTASATTGDTIAIGVGAAAGAGGSSLAIAIGDGSNASNNGTLAVGAGATATGNGSVALGASSSTGTSSVALGNGAQSPGNYTIAIGPNAGHGETHQDTIIIAAKSTAVNATQDHQIVLGTSTNTQLVTAGSIIQGGVISASDQRLKKQVHAEKDALESICDLNPVVFYWDRDAITQANAVVNTDEDDKLQHGLIAQEIEKIFPEFVENIDRGFGSYKCVRYEKLIPVLIAALQELTVKVKNLENSDGR